MLAMKNISSNNITYLWAGDFKERNRRYGENVKKMGSEREKKFLDLIRGELIGLNVKVIGKEIQGRIIDETKNLFVIETIDKKRKKLIKKNNIFEFLVHDNDIKVDGKILAMRPEDRIRKCLI